MIIQWIEIWRLKCQRGYFKSESQFNYLFTLKNVHLSSNSYNFLNAAKYRNEICIVCGLNPPL